MHGQSLWPRVAGLPHNQDDRPGPLPASPLEPRPEATGFRWAA